MEAVQRRARVSIYISEKFMPIAVKMLKEVYEGKAEILPVKLETKIGHPISPGEIYVIMDDSKEMPELSADGFWHTDVAEYWMWRDNQTSFSIYGRNRFEIVEILQEKIGVRIPDPLEHATSQMAESLCNRLCSRDEFFATMVENFGKDEPHNFNMLMKMGGFAH